MIERNVDSFDIDREPKPDMGQPSDGPEILDYDHAPDVHPTEEFPLPVAPALQEIEVPTEPTPVERLRDDIKRIIDDETDRDPELRHRVVDDLVTPNEPPKPTVH